MGSRLCAPTMVWDDRRRHSLLVGDRDMFIASIHVVASQRRRPSRTLLATAGDRLSLHRLHWIGASSEVGGFETENLCTHGGRRRGSGRRHRRVRRRRPPRRECGAARAVRAQRRLRPYMRERGISSRARGARSRGLPRGAAGRLQLPRPSARRRRPRRRRRVRRLARRALRAVAGCPDRTSVLRRGGEVRVPSASPTASARSQAAARSSPCFVQLVTPSGGELFELDDLELARARFEELRP